MHSGFHIGGLPGKPDRASALPGRPGPRPTACPPVARLLPEEA